MYMEDKASLMMRAIKASLLAGGEILDVYSMPFEVELKGDFSPLTAADRRAHKAIVLGLADTGIEILSEEGRDIPYEERKNWDLFWMVDPLDGTKEFVKRNGEFTVNIALIQGSKAIGGVIYAPTLGDLYFGLEGFGAYKMKAAPHTDLSHFSFDGLRKSAQTLPLYSEDTAYKVVGSRSHKSPETEAFLEQLEKERGPFEMVSMGSSLKICLVAEGSAQIYPRFAPTMEWDTAAGHAIVSAAGKEIVDHSTGKPMRYNKPNLLNNWFIVS
jgi:3'(2'), 5'-bisphosphate nucleotidase